MKYSAFGMGLCLVLSAVSWAGLAEVPTGATATYQEWHFTTSTNPAAPEVDDNPIADFPELKAQVRGAFFTPNLVWENGIWKDSALTITIDIPNNRVPNPYKTVQVQMLIRGDLVLSWIRDGEGKDFERLTRLIEPAPGNQGWLLVTDEWRIEPNPSFERLCYGLLGVNGTPAMIDWIKVHTVCVPEPASLGLLLAGGICLFRFKRGQSCKRIKTGRPA
jgi:hypothetical protein